MSAPAPAIALSDVFVSRGAAGSVLRGLSLSIAPGETLALVGRSGAGKSTLLKLINGLILPDAGSVVVEGRDTREWDPFALRRRIGYVLQEIGLFPHLDVARNVGLVPGLLGWEASRTAKRVGEVLTLVGLPPDRYAARPVQELSGGQRQRVGVARALAADPPILLMDEPFGALDPVTRAELQREFAELTRRLGKTIVFVTHDLREALRLGTRIVLLCEGRIVADAGTQEFLRVEHPEVKAFAASFGVVSEAGT